MRIQLRSTGGRYPFSHYDSGSIRASIEVVDGEIRIRIDDIENIDRWEELVGSFAELLEQNAHRETRLRE